MAALVRIRQPATGKYLCTRQFPACWGLKKHAIRFRTTRAAHLFLQQSGWAKDWLNMNVEITLE